MKQKGQMTLEIVIMLMLVINIYIFVTEPLSRVATAGSETIGITALAAKAVDSTANKADIVGISGVGAKESFEISVREEFKEFSCNNTGTVSLSFSIKGVDINDSAGLGVEVNEADIDPTQGAYARSVDFNLDCQDINPVSFDTSETYCVKLENEGVLDTSRIPTVSIRVREGLCDD